MAAHARAERAVIGLAAALGGVALSAVRTADPTITDLTAPALMVAGAWAVGRSQLLRRHRSAALERAAALEERQRIARELHDIVAHRVTTIVIQAEAGIATLGEPVRTRQAFESITGSGREALNELRRLLGLLEPDGDEAARAPQPGLARLDALVRAAREAGMEVTVQPTEGWTACRRGST